MTPNKVWVIEYFYALYKLFWRTFQIFFQMEQKKPQQRKKFTPEEDKIISQWYYDHQNRDKSIGIFRGFQLPGRTAKQCKERYNNYLNPTISHTPLSREELVNLMGLVEQYGRSWALLQKFFPNRSKTALKNAYNKFYLISHDI